VRQPRRNDFRVPALLTGSLLAATLALCGCGARNGAGPSEGAPSPPAPVAPAAPPGVAPATPPGQSPPAVSPPGTGAAPTPPAPEPAPTAPPSSTPPAPAAPPSTTPPAPPAPGTPPPPAPPAPGAPSTPPVAGKPMQIYWIDVEGGAATLVVAPTGETLLMDAGWGDNRGGAARVMPVLQEVGARQLDYFVASHYHVDHLSGVPSLARAIPIMNFVDHGMNTEGNDYGYGGAAARGKRTAMKPGEEIALGDVKITIVTGARQVVDPLPGAKPNPLCEGAQTKTDGNDEDPQSLGFLARFGGFEFVDLGDLTWGVEHRLACPMNRIGEIEVFQSSQHGSAESNPPQLVHALAPQAIVVNNGAGKGGQTSALQVFKRSPGMKDLWQIHRSDAAGGANTEDAFIANTGNTNNYLRATIQADGSYTIFNPRTQMSKTYQSR
jgi:competence protein ComEC